MKYIKLFETHQEYETYINDEQNLVLPNVSFCEDTPNEVHYNPYEEHDYSKDYLTFVALEDGTFQFTNTINYSIDNGETWQTLQGGNSTPTITSGNKVLWKGNLVTQFYVGIGRFSSSGNFDVEGNIMSLCDGDNFLNTIGQESYQSFKFYQLFLNCTKLHSAENLKLLSMNLKEYCYYSMFEGCTSLIIAPELPSTTLASHCYLAMFNGCTSLIIAPELPSTTLVGACYMDMFRECTKLNYIKAMAITGIPGDTPTWVYNVAPSGTFVKNSAATWDETGVDGIPNGWTVEYVSE